MASPDHVYTEEEVRLLMRVILLCEKGRRNGKE
jgi:hypothetical protein